jgi:hypothetical protein
MEMFEPIGELVGVRKIETVSWGNPW